MSFAQVVRIGLEGLVRQFPPGRQAPEDWQPPAPIDMGVPLVPEEEWDALCHGEETND